MNPQRKILRGYPLMAKPGKRRKSGFYRAIKIKAAQVAVSAPARKVVKTMTAHNEFWQETAEWENRVGIWRCTGGTGVLVRLKGMNPAQAKLELLHLGASWEWL